MNDAFFELSSDFMAIGPAGCSRWTAINPALAGRLGLAESDVEAVEFADPADPSRLLAKDGSVVSIAWSVREDCGLGYWVGRETSANLTRELHHRLKNNLQFVVSLLSFQAARADDEEVRTELVKAESRVRAIARLHEGAYSSADFSEVEFGAYLRQLVRDLTAHAAIPVALTAVEVVLPMQQAIALGLIAHELLCTAVQDAADSGIHLSLTYQAERLLSFQFAGPGVDAGASRNRELLEVFVDQLRGTLYTKQDTPMPVTIIFPLIED